jgi:hypothetical protein
VETLIALSVLFNLKILSDERIGLNVPQIAIAVTAELIINKIEEIFVFLKGLKSILTACKNLKIRIITVVEKKVTKGR